MNAETETITDTTKKPVCLIGNAPNSLALSINLQEVLGRLSSVDLDALRGAIEQHTKHRAEVSKELLLKPNPVEELEQPVTKAEFGNPENITITPVSYDEFLNYLLTEVRKEILGATKSKIELALILHDWIGKKQINKSHFPTANAMFYKYFEDRDSCTLTEKGKKKLVLKVIAYLKEK